MDFTKYSEDELRIIIKKVILSSAWTTGTVFANNYSGQVTCTCNQPKCAKTYTWYKIMNGTSHSRPAYICDYKGYIEQRHLRRTLNILNHGSSSEPILYNVHELTYMSKQLLQAACQTAHAANSIVFATLLMEFDVAKLAAKQIAQQTKAKEYAKKRRAKQFLLREQEQIARCLMREAIAKHAPDFCALVVNTTDIAFHVSYAPSRTTISGEPTYFTKAVCGILTPEAIDPTGEQLFNSLNTLRLSEEEIMKILSNHKNEAMRRFATCFGDRKFTTAGMLDSSERVRLLAQERYKQLREQEDENVEEIHASGSVASGT